MNPCRYDVVVVLQFCESRLTLELKNLQLQFLSPQILGRGRDSSCFTLLQLYHKCISCNSVVNKCDEYDCKNCHYTNY